MEKELEEIKAIEEREEMTTEEDMDENNIVDTVDNKNREFYVYAHIRLDRMETFYIGKGKGNRAYELERNEHHDNISNMCGHAVLIIKDNLTENEAYWLERYIIEYCVFELGYGIDIEGYKDYDHKLPHLTNMNWGGRGGKSGVKLSEEHKQKIGEGNKGKKCSEEKKRKIGEANSEALKGRQLSEEHKQNLSKALKGRQFSEEHKQNLSEALKGRQLSEEHKQKLSKKVVCVITGKIFNSITEASNYYKCCNIYKCCIGVRKSAGKLDGIPLQWKYLEDYNNEFKGILINPIAE